jgi:hypothetical protein
MKKSKIYSRLFGLICFTMLIFSGCFQLGYQCNSNFAIENPISDTTTFSEYAPIDNLDSAVANTNTFKMYPVMTEYPPLEDTDFEKMIKDPKPTRDLDDLPSYFSWTDFGGNWLTPVRDQASCGSCWDFAAIGAMEGAINIASHDPDTDIDLSEQYVLSCLSGAGSCSGGYHWRVFEYGQSTSPGSTGNGINGITIEACMPYQAVDYIPCSDKECDDWDYVNLSVAGKLWEIEDYGYSTSFVASDPGTWDIIKTWLLDYGPIAISMYFHIIIPMMFTLGLKPLPAQTMLFALLVGKTIRL